MTDKQDPTPWMTIRPDGSIELSKEFGKALKVAMFGDNLGLYLNALVEETARLRKESCLSVPTHDGEIQCKGCCFGASPITRELAKFVHSKGCIYS